MKKAFAMTTYPNFIRVLLPVLCLLFLLGSTIATAQDSADESFATPEEAVTFYLQAVTEADVSRIMQTFAIDEMSENFSFDLYVERLQILTPQSPAPSDYEFFVEINRAQFTSQLLFQTKNFVYGLLATDKSVTEGQVMLLEPEGFALFALEVNPERLAGLEVVSIDVPFPDMLASDMAQRNSAEQARMYGADELVDRVALLQFEGDYYFSGFSLLRYGEEWKISVLTSPISGASAMGSPMSTTPEDYQDMIASDE